MEPDARPKLGKIEEVVRNLIAITCEGQDYDYIIPSDLVERLNSAIHKAIKPLVPKRYRFTTQSFLFTREGQVPTLFENIIINNRLLRILKFVQNGSGIQKQIHTSLSNMKTKIQL